MVQNLVTVSDFGTHHAAGLWRWRLNRFGFGSRAKPGTKRAKKLRNKMRRAKLVLDVLHRGLRFRLYPSENSCDMKLAVHDDHSVHSELAQAGDVLSQAQTFVDIGGNIGLYSLVARQKMPADARLIVFEPDPDTFEKLRYNMALNDARNATLLNVAVGPRDETLTLHRVSDKNAGRNTLMSDFDEVAEAQGVSVQVRPLLDVLKEQGVDQIDVLKIDVEGFEAHALVPFLETAPDGLLPKYIIIEIVARDHWHKDLIGMLKGAGYRVAYETPDDMHFERMCEGASSPNAR